MELFSIRIQRTFQLVSTHTHLVTQEHKKPCTHVPVRTVNKTPSDEGLHADEHRNTGNNVHMYIRTYVHKYIRTRETKFFVNTCTYIHTNVLSCVRMYILTFVRNYFRSYVVSHVHACFLTYVRYYLRK